MIMQSDTINEIATALSKAQAEVKSAEKDSTNPFYKNSYASLDAVWEAIRTPFTKNGLSIVQTTTTRNDTLSTEATGSTHFAVNTYVITTLCHTSGQWIRGEYLLNPTKHDPQGLGAAFTYARRYTLSAICGVTQTDDDAETAVSRNTTTRPMAATPTRTGQTTRTTF